MSAQKLSLSEWASRRFNPPPAERTLRLWVAQKRILPAPVKIGRAYYVEPGAKHIAEAMAEAANEGRLKQRVGR